MKFTIQEIETPEVMEAWRPVIMLALGDIEYRSRSERERELVYEYIRDSKLPNTDDFALWIAIDDAKLGEWAELNDAACGVLTLELREDGLGMPAAFASRGWIRPGYHGQPFDAVLPRMKHWARVRKCKTLWTMTGRSSASAAPNQWNIKHLLKRYEGLASYWKWISKRGFVQRETLFCLEL